MPNLALHKPCVASSFENVGTVVENATDGDDGSRWGSQHRDGEWIQVDLQQEVALYQIKIHWEAAYASNYTIALSDDGKNWTYQVYTQSFPVEEALYVRYLQVAPRSVQVIADGTPCAVEVEAQDQFQGAFELKANDVEYDFYAGAKDGDGKFAAAPVAAADIRYDEASKSIVAHKTGMYSMVAHVVGGASVAGVSGGALASVADTILVESLNFEAINLAYRKTATASSQNGDGSGAEKAVDGDTTGSRWESVWQSDDEQLTVDLEQAYMINKVVVFWENARAKEYNLQVSEDGESWQTVKNVKDSPVGGETIEFAPVAARFVRIHGVSRVMEAYGYSIYELQVYGKSVVTGIDSVRDGFGDGSDGNALKDGSGDASRSVYDLNGIKYSKARKGNLSNGIYVVGKRKIAFK